MRTIEQWQLRRSSGPLRPGDTDRAAAACRVSMLDPTGIQKNTIMAAELLENFDVSENLCRLSEAAATQPPDLSARFCSAEENTCAIPIQKQYLIKIVWYYNLNLAGSQGHLRA